MRIRNKLILKMYQSAFTAHTKSILFYCFRKFKLKRLTFFHNNTIEIRSHNAEYRSVGFFDKFDLVLSRTKKAEKKNDV